MKPKKKPGSAALLQELPGAPMGSTEDVDVSALVRDLGAMIDAARKQVSVAANAALTALYWHIGHRIRTDVLEEHRAEYGAQIVATVSRRLEAQYGRGFNEKSLRHGADVGAGAEASLHEAQSPAMTMASDQSELVLYQTDEGITRIHVRLVDGSVCDPNRESPPAWRTSISRLGHSSSGRTPTSIAWPRDCVNHGYARCSSRCLRASPRRSATDDLRFETGSIQLFGERGTQPHGPVFEMKVADIVRAKELLGTAGCSVVEENPAVPRVYMRDPYGLVFNLDRA